MKVNLRIYSYLPIILILIVILLALGACGKETPIESKQRLSVMATTTIVADIVKQVGGDLIDLDILLPYGTDPHTYTPAPQDIAGIADAAILFANGAGLETFLESYLANIGEGVRIVELSDGVGLISSEINHDHSIGGEQEELDPHTWTDPTNVMIWVDKIARTLSEIDPEHSEIFYVNAAAYVSKLEELDAWISSQVMLIPPDNRKIVSDHYYLGYFAQHYGFHQIGTVVPGASTLSEPSAQQMAQLENLIREENVHSIFVDKTANTILSERIATDTGVGIVYLYIGSLTEGDGEAGSYIDYMHYNVSEIVDALK